MLGLPAVGAEMTGITSARESTWAPPTVVGLLLDAGREPPLLITFLPAPRGAAIPDHVPHSIFHPPRPAPLG
jgi:hypothetical protein